MAAIKVKAAKIDDVPTIIFDADKAGIDGEMATQGVVRSDGKPVILEGRHVAVKEALRNGVLVEVKGKLPDHEPKAAS